MLKKIEGQLELYYQGKTNQIVLPKKTTKKAIALLAELMIRNRKRPMSNGEQEGEDENE